MIAHVITITSIEESVQVAERCIKSAEKFSIKVNKFPAYTPNDNPRKILNILQD